MAYRTGILTKRTQLGIGDTWLNEGTIVDLLTATVHDGYTLIGVLKRTRSGKVVCSRWGKPLHSVVGSVLLENIRIDPLTTSNIRTTNQPTNQPIKG